MALPTIAAMTPSDWDVEIHDARTTPVDYDKKVDLVGITSYTADITNACKIADGFRSKGVKVVMGGVHGKSDHPFMPTSVLLKFLHLSFTIS